MEILAIGVVVLAVITFAFWWAERNKHTDDDLPWERRRQTSPSAEPEPPPPEEVVADELRPAVEKLRSATPMVATSGAEELGRSSHPEAVGPLIAALGIEQRSVRFAVFQALVSLRAHSAGPLRAAAGTNPDAVVRELAGLILGQIERIEKGEPPTPVEELLVLSDKQIGEMTRDLERA